MTSVITVRKAEADQRCVGALTPTHKRLFTAACFHPQGPHPAGWLPFVAYQELRRPDLNQHEDVQSVTSCRWMTLQSFPFETPLAGKRLGEKGSNLHPLLNRQVDYR